MYDDETVFHGAHDVLVSFGICRADRLPTGVRSSKSSSYKIKEPYWSAKRLFDGSYIFTRQTEEAWRKVEANHDSWRTSAIATPEEKCEKDEKENLRNFPNPESWLEHIEDYTCKLMRISMADHSCKVKNKNGTQFFINASDMEEIRNSVEVALQKIRNLKVTVTRWDKEVGSPEARANAAAAQTDAKFQHFLSRVLPSS